MASRTRARALNYPDKDGGSKYSEWEVDEQGRMQGVKSQWFPNGVLWKQLPYLDNKLHGLVSIYNALGELTSQARVEHGKPIGVHEYKWATLEKKGRSENDSQGLQISNRWWWKNGNTAMSEAGQGVATEYWMEDGTPTQDKQAWQAKWEEAGTKDYEISSLPSRLLAARSS
jgi:hypothetical protein